MKWKARSVFPRWNTKLWCLLPQKIVEQWSVDHELKNEKESVKRLQACMNQCSILLIPTMQICLFSYKSISPARAMEYHPLVPLWKKKKRSPKLCVAENYEQIPYILLKMRHEAIDSVLLLRFFWKHAVLKIYSFLFTLGLKNIFHSLYKRNGF